MKEGFDKEIDLLLRRRVGAGAKARAFADAGAVGDEAHLDADELSAFAEGALPATARVAAASHMADCDECRGLAVDLSRASGAESVLEKRAVAASIPASASLVVRGRGWLSSFFAPRALRYAAPALALCLIAVVSFVALRSRREEANLARQTAGIEGLRPEVAKNQAGAPDAATANANVSAIAPGMVSAESRNASAAGALARSPAESAKDASVSAGSPALTEAKKADEPAPPPPPAAYAPVDAAPPVMSKAGPPVEAGETARGDYNKEKSARQSQPEEEVAVTNDYSAQQRRANNQARGIDNNIQMPDGARGQKRGAADSASSKSGGGGGLASAAPKSSDRDKSAPSPSAPASRRARASEDARERNEDDEAARASDARSVAGHRFRREGGAWVDVNYKSSMASTGVRRGTEAFRALVADIPEIGRIASQLGGEVVVVVKGRAYRIR